MNCQDGGTLLELVLTLILISILSSVLVVKLDTQPFEEQYLVDDILQALSYTRKAAAQSGCRSRFSIDSNGYQLALDSSCTVQGNPVFNTSILLPTGEFYQKTDFPSSVTNVNSQSVIYYPQGWACEANEHSIATREIIISGQETQTIQIVCSTGYAYEI